MMQQSFFEYSYSYSYYFSTISSFYFFYNYCKKILELLQIFLYNYIVKLNLSCSCNDSTL